MKDRAERWGGGGGGGEWRDVYLKRKMGKNTI